MWDLAGVGVGRQRRRQELVRATFEMIAKNGFEGLRTRDIADLVGVNIATLHYYFPTKESLIRAVLDQAMIRFRSTLTPHGSPADQLRNHLRAVRKLLIEEPELKAVMAELALRSAHDRSIAGIMAQMYDSWHKAVRGLLRRAVKDGGLRPELDSDGVAALIVATLTASTLPTLSGTPRSDQAMRQLERWLGISGSKPRAGPQATD
ncbi:MAG TPA: TetR/AcrR family transcriptional regulator [Candidatus Dormibacteraeota bacterium]|nr:TetR/AcrR family transcriptional regulator [Candidatus Dormibacteraeota bacterium]